MIAKKDYARCSDTCKCLSFSSHHCAYTTAYSTRYCGPASSLHVTSGAMFVRKTQTWETSAPTRRWSRLVAFECIHRWRRLVRYLKWQTINYLTCSIFFFRINLPITKCTCNYWVHLHVLLVCVVHGFVTIAICMICFVGCIRGISVCSLLLFIAACWFSRFEVIGFTHFVLCSFRNICTYTFPMWVLCE